MSRYRGRRGSLSPLMLLIALVGVGTALVCQVVASRASQNFGTELRHDLFAKINSLSCQDIDQITYQLLMMLSCSLTSPTERKVSELYC